MENIINRHESATLINALSAGVVPRIGLRHIAVGRQQEVKAFLQDLKNIEAGGGGFRFVCGPYGSGKSFLLQMIRNHSLERSFVVMDADLSPERRLTGTRGQGLSTYRELMRHVSAGMRPEGGALENILQKWIAAVQYMTAKDSGLNADDPAFMEAVNVRMKADILSLSEMTCGFEFTIVLDAYWSAVRSGNDGLKQAALRWLRGEYATKTEARKDLPVDSIIDDQNWYEFLKLFAVFVKKAGFKGLLVFVDEGVNLYKITQKQSRDSNYEKLLTIFNDIMQGKAGNIGFFLSGTPQFIYDERRGLFSYEALRSRLAGNRFSAVGHVGYNSPIIKLNQLSNEEIYLLLERLCNVHSAHYEYECKLGAEELMGFMNDAYSRLGAKQLLTPRELTRDFLGLLDALYSSPGITFEQLMRGNENSLGRESGQNEGTNLEDDLFADFEL